MTSSLFGGVAGHYAATRPSYPAAVYAAVAETIGRPFGELTVVDVGAGTGIATRAMRELGATVTAVEPSVGMLGQLATTVPDAGRIVGDGNALPIGDASADLVTFAQSLHWTDPNRSIPEALRVLRPGGALAAWWNVPDFGIPWVSAQSARLRVGAPTYHGFSGTDIGPGLAHAPFHLTVRNLDFPWGRDIPLDQHIAMLSTQSYVAALDEPTRKALLATEHEELAGEFPGRIVAERYVTRLTIAWRD